MAGLKGSQRLGDEALGEALAGLSGWRLDEGRQAINRCFRFQDFGTAFAFMTRVALAAEKADHHPEWSNSWNEVEIQLTTHSEKGLTMKDVRLAAIIDQAASAHGDDPRN